MFVSPFRNTPIPSKQTFEQVALSNELPYMYRVQAINALGLSADVRSTEVLYKCLNDTSPGIRGWAAQNLGYLESELDEHKGQEIKQVLSIALSSEKDKKVQEAITNAIVYITEKREPEPSPPKNYRIDKEFPFPKQTNVGSLFSQILEEATNPENAELRILLDLQNKNKERSLSQVQSIIFEMRLAGYKERISSDAQYKEHIKTIIHKSFSGNERKILLEILELQSSS